MMRHMTVLLGLLALGACAGGDKRQAVDLLQHRLHAQLATDTDAGAVTVQNLPDGARIVFADAVRPIDPAPRISMVEALLDPALLRIAVAAPPGLPPDEASRRVRDWTDAFTSMQLADAMQTPAATEAAAPSGMTVTIQVVCPSRARGRDYGYGARRPACF
jgi:hypothetical protein